MWRWCWFSFPCVYLLLQTGYIPSNYVKEIGINNWWKRVSSVFGHPVKLPSRVKHSIVSRASQQATCQVKKNCWFLKLIYLPDALIFSETTCTKYTEVAVHFCRSPMLGDIITEHLPWRPRSLCLHWTHSWLQFSTGSESGLVVGAVNVTIWVDSNLVQPTLVVSW